MSLTSCKLTVIQNFGSGNLLLEPLPKIARERRGPTFFESRTLPGDGCPRFPAGASCLAPRSHRSLLALLLNQMEYAAGWTRVRVAVRGTGRSLINFWVRRRNMS